MANEDSVLREVDQELAEERQWAMFRKYGPSFIAAAIVAVLAVGGWEFWNARENAVAEKQAVEFRNAIDLLAKDETGGRAALQAIVEEGTSGYAMLAEFHRAASFARGGERLAALQAFRSIYNNGAAPKRVKDLARLRAAYLALADGRDAVMSDLDDLPDRADAFSYQAKEISGIAALDAKDYETALTTFRQLSIDIGAPEPIRSRAEEFAALASEAKAGVNITGETRVDDLLSAIGEDAKRADEDAGANGGETKAEDAADATPEAAAPDAAKTPETDDAPPADPVPEPSENE